MTSQGAFSKQLESWQVLPRPERLTELYFTDYRGLPAMVKAGATHKVAFTIHSLEHQTIMYHYTITAVPSGDGVAHQMNEGTLTLRHDQSQVISQNITVPLTDDRIAVKVGLEYQGIAPGDDAASLQKQSVHYWVKVADSGKEKYETA